MQPIATPTGMILFVDRRKARKRDKTTFDFRDYRNENKATYTRTQYTTKDYLKEATYEESSPSVIAKTVSTVFFAPAFSFHFKEA